MDKNELFGHTFNLLEKSLNLRAARHGVISANIANMDTPGYKAFDLLIEKELAAYQGTENKIGLTKSDPGHFPLSQDKSVSGDMMVKESGQFSLRKDGNTVNIDRSMSKLAENNLMYNIAAKILQKKFQGMKSVIQESK